MDLLIIILIFLDTIIFIVYSIFFVSQLIKRKKYLASIDKKMLNFGQIITWIGLIGVFAIHKRFNTEYYLVYMTILIILFIIGSRFYSISFIIKEENKEAFFYNFDQWLEKMYRKYLESLL